MGYVGRTPAYGYFERQVESGDGSTTQFNLDYPVASPNQLLVSVDGIIQEPDYSYSTTVSSGQGKINFSEAPDSSSRIFIIYTGRQLLTATPNTASSYIDEFNGDGSTTAFTLTRTPSSTDGSNFIVYIDNVYQREGSSYAFTVSGSTITFTSAPASGTNNIQVYQLATANAVATVTDGAVTTAKLANGAVTTAKINDGDVTLAKLASDASSGLITEIDMWVVGTSMTSLSGLTTLTNWSRATSLALTPYKGSGLTEASNNFSFPSTGYWEIYVQVYIYNATSATDHYIDLRTCTDGSTYSATNLFFNGTRSTGNVGFNGSTVLKITDITNQKFNLTYTANAGNYTIIGSTTRFDTGLIAKKIGEI